jgi:hypothetical protein
LANAAGKSYSVGIGGWAGCLSALNGTINLTYMGSFFGFFLWQGTHTENILCVSPCIAVSNLNWTVSATLVLKSCCADPLGCELSITTATNYDGGSSSYGVVYRRFCAGNWYRDTFDAGCDPGTPSGCAAVIPCNPVTGFPF